MTKHIATALTLLCLAATTQAQTNNCSCVESTLLSSTAFANCPSTHPRRDQTWQACGAQRNTYAVGECGICPGESACQPIVATPTINYVSSSDRCRWKQSNANRGHRTLCYTGCKTTGDALFQYFCDSCSTGGSGSPPPDDDEGGAGCVGGEENVNNEGCGSPILIDVRGQEGFELTNLENGVSFDLNSDGIPERMSWTAARSDDAFLALDRNGNGTIDNGEELFGNYTSQPASDEPNGFRALAVYDENQHGGNGDGIINSQDAVFSRLQLWLDKNHDGVSQPRELHSLAHYRIVGLELDYGTSNRRDEHGNYLRYWSRVYLRDGRTRLSVDVFFLTAGP